jgi:hypothetical protein
MEAVARTAIYLGVNPNFNTGLSRGIGTKASSPFSWHTVYNAIQVYDKQPGCYVEPSNLTKEIKQLSKSGYVYI